MAKIQDTKVVAGFPGVGKSILRLNNPTKFKIADFDISQFPKEDFPKNYVRAVKECIKKFNYDYILISTDKEILKEFKKAKIFPVIIYPSQWLKEEYMDRYKSRGNSKEYLKRMDKKFDRFISELANTKKCRKVVLKKKQFISDVIHKI